MLTEVKGKVKEGHVEVVYLEAIEYSLGIPERLRLKFTSLPMVEHVLRKYRAMLDLFFA